MNLNVSPAQPERTNEMRFMVIAKTTSENEGAMPDPQFMADMNIRPTRQRRLQLAPMRVRGPRSSRAAASASTRSARA